MCYINLPNHFGDWGTSHFVKSLRIRNFSGRYFPTLRLNTDQKNSEYRHFSGSEQDVNRFRSIVFIVMKLFSAWCPLKGHTYLHKTAVLSIWHKTLLIFSSKFSFCVSLITFD